MALRHRGRAACTAALKKKRSYLRYKYATFLKTNDRLSTACHFNVLLAYSNTTVWLGGCSDSWGEACLLAKLLSSSLSVVSVPSLVVPLSAEYETFLWIIFILFYFLYFITMLRVQVESASGIPKKKLGNPDPIAAVIFRGETTVQDNY